MQSFSVSHQQFGIAVGIGEISLHRRLDDERRHALTAKDVAKRSFLTIDPDIISRSRSRHYRSKFVYIGYGPDDRQIPGTILQGRGVVTLR